MYLALASLGWITIVERTVSGLKCSTLAQRVLHLDFAVATDDLIKTSGGGAPGLAELIASQP